MNKIVNGTQTKSNIRPAFFSFGFPLVNKPIKNNTNPTGVPSIAAINERNQSIPILFFYKYSI